MGDPGALTFSHGGLGEPTIPGCDNSGVVLTGWSTHASFEPEYVIGRVAVWAGGLQDQCAFFYHVLIRLSTSLGFEVVKDVLIGGAIGAGVGAAGGAIGGGGKGAGKGAGIGGLVGATAGTLYGLNEANQHDARYAGAYRTCMHRRGYTR